MELSSLSASTAWAAAEDDRRRLAGVFEHAAPSLYRYAIVRLGGDAHLAEDFMQQLWVQALDASTRVPTNELEFWLRAILTNLIRTHWRKAARRPTAPLERPEVVREMSERLKDGPLPGEMIERAEMREQLLLTISSLPAADQELIFGFYFDNASQSTLARRAGCSVRAVEGRLYRARQALRERLARLAEQLD